MKLTFPVVLHYVRMIRYTKFRPPAVAFLHQRADRSERFNQIWMKILDSTVRLQADHYKCFPSHFLLCIFWLSSFLVEANSGVFFFLSYTEDTSEIFDLPSSESSATFVTWDEEQNGKKIYSLEPKRSLDCIYRRLLCLSERDTVTLPRTASIEEIGGQWSWSDPSCPSVGCLLGFFQMVLTADPHPKIHPCTRLPSCSRAAAVQSERLQTKARFIHLSCSGHFGHKNIGRESPQSLRNVTQADDIISKWNYTTIGQSRHLTFTYFAWLQHIMAVQTWSRK